jgi:hypothetical protein
MIDARRPCPDSALLAAFLDGTLVDYERSAVVTHLIECAECRSVAVTVVELREVDAQDTLWHPDRTRLPASPPNTGGMTRWTREKTRAPALAAVLLAALAVPAYFFLDLDSAQHQAVSTLVELADGTRLTRGRVSSPHTPRLRRESSSAPVFSFVKFQQTAATLRASSEGDYGASSRRIVGVAALLTGDLDDAIESLVMAAAAEDANAKIANDLATAYYERFVRRDRADDLPAALSAVERALRLEPAFEEALFNRALIVTALGLFSEARPAWEAYLGADSTSEWAVEARTNLRQVQQRLAETDEWNALRASLSGADGAAALRLAARDHPSRARDLFENHLLKEWVAAARADGRRDDTLARLTGLGEALRQESGDRFYADLALRLVRLDASPPSRQQSAVVGYEQFLEGAALLSANRFEEGIATLRAGQRRLGSADSPLELKAAIEVATGDYFAGRYQTAIAVLPGLRDAAKARGYRTLSARASWILGLAHFAVENFAAAAHAYEETLAEATSTRDAETRAAAALLLANLNWMHGNRARAWRYRNTAAALLESGVSMGTRINVLLGAAGDALAAGEYDAALLFQRAMLDRGFKLNLVLETQARTQRALSLHRLGRQQEAVAELDASRRLLPSIVDSRLQARVEADVLTAAAEMTRGDDPEAAIAAAQRALTFPDIATDRLRLARLQLRLAEAQLTRGDLRSAERAAAAGIAALEQQRATAAGRPLIGASDSAWALYTRAVEVALRQNDLARAFQYAERGRVSRGLTPGGVATLELREAQQRVAPETALVFLNQFDDSLDVWVVRRSAAVRYPVALSRARSAVLVGAHLDEIRRRVPSPAIGAELFDALLQPGEDTLRGSHALILVADAPYQHMAAAALYNRRLGRFLVEDFKVVATSSATDYVRALAGTAGTLPGAARRAAVMPAVAGDRETVAAVTTAYSNASVRSPESVTARNIVEDLRDRDVVHIAAPIVGSEEFPAMSHLVIADEAGEPHGGAMRAADLASLPHIRAQLVVLEQPASGAARGELRARQTLARALLAAGVRHVVSPVTPVRSDDVAEMWRQLHRRFAAGHSAVDSLRHAQLAALSADRRSGAWAALAVFGADQ